MNIGLLDKNLAIETEIKREGLAFFDPLKPPFRVYGVYHDGARYRRMPQDVANATSQGVANLCTATAGGRVRFVTNSPFVAIKCRFRTVCRMPHMAFTGIYGFDLYVDDGNGERFVNSFKPAVDVKDGYESLIELGEKKERVITINFPLYNGVEILYIGLDSESSISAAPDYSLDKPVVYYGSSITQGGCASRPGMSYQAILSRRLNIDHVNLGFSGNARGEKPIVEYMSGLEMSAFVCDYDHNAPNVAHLQATHKPLYLAVREKHPDLPILFLSRPAYFSGNATHEVVRATYEYALSVGDKNVYFIDGRELMSDEIRNEGTVDNCHPTDLGFFSMANKIEPVLRMMLGK